MTATSAPFGLRPRYSMTGPVRPQAYPYGIASGYASGILKYQPVTMATTGVIQAATTNQDIIGVFAGWEGVDTTGRFITSDQWLANQAYNTGEVMNVYIFQDPTIVYSIQCDGSLAQTSIGDQADFSSGITNGSTVTGLSTCTISSSLKGAGTQGQLRILELTLNPDNAWGDAYTVVNVQIARSQYVASKVAI